MTPRRIGIMFSDRPSVQEQLAVARLAEHLGYSSVWVGETRLSRDAISMLGALAAGTKSVHLGSAIVNTWNRGPVLTALTFATLDELAPGRVVLGLGSYSAPLAEIQGIERRRPVQQMREYVAAVRRLFAMEEPVSVDSDLVRICGAKLDIGYGLTREPVAVPIYIGATLPKMIRLAGEIADGVLLNSFMGNSYTMTAVAEIHEAATGAGRDPASVDCAQFIPVAMSDRMDEARAVARRVLAMYLGGQPHVARAAGIDPGLAQRLREAIGGWPPAASGVDAAMRLVNDELVDELTVVGSADRCRQLLEERVALGISHPIVFPLTDNARDVCRLFAPQERTAHE